MKLETIQKEMLEIAVEFDLFCEKTRINLCYLRRVVFLVPSDTKALFHGMMILMWLCPAANLKDF